MKKLLLATTALALFGSVGAYAADMNVAPVYKAPPSSPANSWTGFYMGVSGGYASGSFDTSINTTPPFPPGVATSFSDTGWLGGGQVGYNYQIGNFVLGAEMDALFSTQKTTVGVGPSILPAGSTIAQDWFGTARLKAGYLVTNNLLLYGTGGGAYGNETVTVGTLTVRMPDVGWAAGGGAEWLLGQNWLIRAQYLRVDLTGINGTFPAGNFKTESVANVITGGIGFKFP